MIKFFAKKINNKKGFTLIELLIVIAVLGILAALAAPRFLGVAKTMKEKTDVESATVLARETEVLILSGALPKTADFTITTKTDPGTSGTIGLGKDYVIPKAQVTGSEFVITYKSCTDPASGATSAYGSFATEPFKTTAPDTGYNGVISVSNGTNVIFEKLVYLLDI